MHRIPKSAAIFAAIAALALAPRLASAQDNSPAAAGELEASKTTQPLAPRESLAKLHVAPGVRVELAAAEPQVVDPVAVRFDERGRMWVVEMSDYPLGPEPGQAPSSRIKILTDRDGDGYFETSQVFADGLLFATGLQPYGQGVFATYSGRLAWFGDTNNDGVCDLQQEWFRGFAEENSQLRANHPTLAIDGWIDVANGLRGGKVVRADDPNASPLSISGMDFRFHPRTHQYTAATGVGQFGLTHDDFGRRFVCSNRNPLKHIVLANHYLTQAGNIAIAAAAQDVAIAGEQSRIYPLTRAWTTSTLHAGQFTAACGVLIYRGDALPAEMYGDGLTCDPTGNLIHREKLQDQGASFASRPVREGVEFLASEDEWFRPVNLSLGPDGALYIADMYRAVIEHPQFMPDELKSRPDLRLGNDRGRIYRLVASSAAPQREPRRPWSTLADNDAAGWVRALSDPNGWTRDTAARLLAEQGAAPAGSLERLAGAGTSPVARARALWLLAQFRLATAEILLTALRDPSPDVRETALRIAETLDDAKVSESRLRTAMFRAFTDDHPRVRFQAMLSLSPLAPGEIDKLAPAALAGCQDPWQQAAARLAAARDPGRLLQQLTLLATEDSAAEPSACFGDLLKTLLQDLPPDASADEAWRSVARLLRTHPVHPASIEALQGWLGRFAARQAPDQVVQAEHQALLGQTRQALEETVAASNSAPEIRLPAVRCLAYFPQSTAILSELALNAGATPSLRTAAIEAIARYGTLATWSELTRQVAQLPPVVKAAVLDGCLGSKERSLLLLQSIEAGALRAADVDPARTRRLTSHRDPQVKQLAAQLLSAGNADRDAALARYQASLQLTPDLRQGRLLFRKLCSSCHRVGEDGVNVAPDIADSRTKTPLQLLTDVLQPNRAVDGNYLNYVIETDEGLVVSGVIAEENATTITIKQPEDKRVVLRREQIVTLQSTGQSLMPEGLERDLSLQQMADLVGYLKNWRYLK